MKISMNQKIANNQEINKILVVGHELSNFELLLKLLKNHNIKHSNPLEKEGIEAKEISNILLKAHGIKNLNKNFKQISVNQVWNGLAMDLMVSNLNNKLWSWADSNSLPLLNYWKSLDANLGFILVYNSPQDLLVNMMIQQDLQFINIKKELKKWYNYNRELLNFYYHNQERALLVNSEQANINSQKYLYEVGKQIGINTQKIENNFTKKPDKKQVNNTNKMYLYLIEHLLNENNFAKELYLELESISNLPISQEELKKPSAEELIYLLINEEKYKTTIESKIKKLQNKTNIFSNKLKKENYKIDLLKTENKSQLEQLLYVQEEVENISTKKNKEIKEKEKENKVLLTELIKIKEELKNTHLKNSELKDNINILIQEKQYYGAENRVKQQLSYRLGSIIILKSKSFISILTLPFSLYIETRKFKKEKKKVLPPISTYVDADKGEKVKKHLSYKLGKTLIETNYPIGIFKLPFRLKKVYNEFKKGE